MSRRADYDTSLILAVNIFLFTLFKIANFGTAEILGNVGKITDLEEHEPDSNEIQTHGERYYPKNGSKVKPHYNEIPSEITKKSFKDFDYTENKGPDTWPNRFPWCSGPSQSPVALDTSTATSTHRPRILWWGYSLKPRRMTLSNNGHTVVLRAEWPPPMEAPYHWYLPGDEEYVFDQLHFHWGAEDLVGSEHTLNNERFPLEMHVVHHRRDLNNLENAALYLGGIRVVAFFFRVSDHHNLYLEKLVSALSAVSRPDSSTNIEPFPLTRLIHRFPRFFLAYNGSLTTPPCAETVSWVIHQEPAVLSKRQMQEFRNLLNHEGRQIGNNYRPLQPLNGRTVLHIR